MCKNFIIPFIPNGKGEIARALAKGALEKMTTIDRDGVGYVEAYGGKDYHVSRWLSPKDAFKRFEPLSGSDQKIIEVFKDTVKVDLSYVGQGERVADPKALMLHSRMRTTGDVSLENVHPFDIEGSLLIHNGVINNHHLFDKKISTCDSEAILIGYLELGINYMPEAIQDLANLLSGYYACAVLSNDENDTQIMDVFVGNNASLVVGFVVELDSYVICTTSDILRETCKENKFTVRKIYDIKDGSFIRFNIETGALTHTIAFKPGTRAYVYNGAGGNGYYNGVGKTSSYPARSLPAVSPTATLGKTTAYHSGLTAEEKEENRKILSEQEWEDLAVEGYGNYCGK